MKLKKEQAIYLSSDKIMENTSKTHLNKIFAYDSIKAIEGGF